jgi:hypothetical protein
MKGSTKRFLVYATLCAAVTVTLTFLATRASATISDCLDATCRISAGNARGTGCVFEQSNEIPGTQYRLWQDRVLGCNFFAPCAHVV